MNRQHVFGWCGNCCAVVLVLDNTVSKAFDALEFFSGVGNVSRCLKLAGHAVGSFDIKLGTPAPGKQNCMDLLTPAGMSCFGHSRMCVHAVHSFGVCGFGERFHSRAQACYECRPRCCGGQVLGYDGDCVLKFCCYQQWHAWSDTVYATW